MRRVYICGDSFAVPDSEYGPCWVDILANRFDVTNLSKVCASNLLISQQVDIAIASKPDFIICLGTSSTRQEVNYFGDVIPYSIHSIDESTPFSAAQKLMLKNYVTEFFDLDIAIYNNQCIIENTLQKLKDSGINFIFDKGGFEHKSYSTKSDSYFNKYSDYISDVNLWDYAPKRSYRPYYHITDKTAHENIAAYYTKRINDQT